MCEQGPRQNGVRLNPKVKESVFDTAVRTKRLELIHLLDDATRKQASWIQPCDVCFGLCSLSSARPIVDDVWPLVVREETERGADEVVHALRVVSLRLVVFARLSIAGCCAQRLQWRSVGGKS